MLSTLLRERSFGRLQTLPHAPLTGARSVSQTWSCMRAPIRGRCALSMRPPETFSGIWRVGAQYWMAHRFVDGALYWAYGYREIDGTGNNKVFAFTVVRTHSDDRGERE